jgi:hypothetical protein
MYVYIYIYIYIYAHELGCVSQYSDGLGTGRPGFNSRGRRKRFLPLHSVQIGSGAHPFSYPVGTEGSFPGVKAAVV